MPRRGMAALQRLSWRAWVTPEAIVVRDETAELNQGTATVGWPARTPGSPGRRGKLPDRSVRRVRDRRAHARFLALPAEDLVL